MNNNLLPPSSGSALKRFLENRGIYELPSTWKVKLLDQVADRGSGHTPNKKKPEYWNGGIKWVSLSDSNKLDKLFITETAKEISEEGLQNSSAVLHPPGVVILSRDAGVGKSAITTEEMAVSQHFMVWACGPELDNFFLYYWLQFFKPEFEKIAVGSTIKTIGLPYFKKLQVLLPPVSEQRKIAEILSTWDEAIALTEQFIATLQQRKKVLMQRLLTGEVRFPGFEDGWKREKLKDVTDFLEGPGLRKWQFRNDGMPFINIRCIKDGTLDLRNVQYIDSEEANSRYKHFFLGDGDIVVSSSATLGRVAIVRKQDLPLMLNTSVIRFRSKDETVCHASYLFHFLHSSYFFKQVLMESQGSAQPNFGPSHLRRVFILLPNIKEQIRISEALSTIDQDIALRVQLLSVIKLEKKGLMQRLLTGEVQVTAD